MHVDPKAWKDLGAALMETYHRIAQIRAESEERLAKDAGSPSIRIMSFQTLFELPPAKSDARVA